MRSAFMIAGGLLAASVTPAANAQPHYFNGRYLLGVCSVEESHKNFIRDYQSCIHFIAGVQDAIEADRFARKQPTCMPAGDPDDYEADDEVSIHDIREMIVERLQGNEELLMAPAANIVRDTLVSLWPGCKR